MPKSGDITIKK